MATHAQNSSAAAATPIGIVRVEDGVFRPAEDQVATEEPLEIQLGYARKGLPVTKKISITMRTPGEDAELAAGFLFTEGIVRDRADVLEVVIGAASESSQRNTVRLVLQDGVEVDLRTLERHFYTTSSCGVCGKTSLAALRATGRYTLDADWPKFTAAAIRALPARLREAQAVFARTGGLHAAGLFDQEGRLVDLREDVGRHNAVDKIIGAQFLASHTPLAHQLLLVSGRASFELVQKTIMAGIPVLAAVGAPSSLAVELARECDLTLLGFVSAARFNVYSGLGRIVKSPA